MHRFIALPSWITLLITSAAFAQSPPQPSSQSPVTAPPPVAKMAPVATPPPLVAAPQEQLYRVVQPPYQYEPVITPRFAPVTSSPPPYAQIPPPVAYAPPPAVYGMQGPPQVVAYAPQQVAWAGTAGPSRTVVIGPGPISLTLAWTGRVLAANFGKSHVLTFNHTLFSPVVPTVPTGPTAYYATTTTTVAQPPVQQVIQYVPVQQPAPPVIQYVPMPTPPVPAKTYSEEAPPAPVAPSPQSKPSSTHPILRAFQR
jgi:hypothetical protein